MTKNRRHVFLPILSIEEDENGRMTGKLDFSGSFSHTAQPDGPDLDESDDERVAAAVRVVDEYLKAHPGLLSLQVFGNVNDHLEH